MRGLTCDERELCHGQALCHRSHRHRGVEGSPAPRDEHARLHTKGPPKCHSVGRKWDILIMPNISVLLHHRPLITQGCLFSWRNNGPRRRFWTRLSTPGRADDILMKWCSQVQSKLEVCVRARGSLRSSCAADKSRITRHIIDLFSEISEQLLSLLGGPEQKGLLRYFCVVCSYI